MVSGSTRVAVSALCWFCGASFATAQVVVLNARGPSSAAYPQGTVLPADRTIYLKSGDQLTVLDAAGSHLLTGPTTVRAGQVDTEAKAALKDIFRRANASRPGIAAVRGFTLQDEAPVSQTPSMSPLWRLDVQAWQEAEPNDAHNFCVPAGRAPVLTREAAQNSASLQIFDDTTHASRTFKWPAGMRDMPWPDDLSFSDGQTYGLNLNAAGATSVRWRSIPPSSRSLVDLARTLLDNGCYDQLDTLKAEAAGT
ncbi:MAG TPA: hypothetical protein VKQ54_09295 [Caulobacteraceae bacterium]|nr:hypothetical protein [Caulobacteraceae bacterium]